MQTWVRYTAVMLTMAAALGIPAASTSATASGAQAGGMAAAPDFAGSASKYRQYRTAIREEYANGPNFAGHYRLIIIGCGESCVFAWLADMRTGKLSDFPISGFNYFRLHLTFTPDSPAVTATWQQQTPSIRCVSRHFTLADGAFRTTREDDVKLAECPNY